MGAAAAQGGGGRLLTGRRGCAAHAEVRPEARGRGGPVDLAHAGGRGRVVSSQQGYAALDGARHRRPSGVCMSFEVIPPPALPGNSCIMP